MIEYPHGLDCIWIAADLYGNLAAFVTAGQAPIPNVALENSSYMSLSDMGNYIDTLPKKGGYKLFSEDTDTDYFNNLAELGFYVYDWQDIHRPIVQCSDCYEIVSIPLSLLKMIEFDELYPDHKSFVKLESVQFGISEKISVKKLISSTWFNSAESIFESN